MKICKIVSVLLTITLLTASFGFCQQSDSVNVEKNAIMNTDKNNAYAIFANPVISNKMTFIDGIEQGVTDKTDPLYSEPFSMNGIDGRKVYKENYVYFKLDRSFFSKDDNEFMISITFYDFGPDIGYFHVEYNSSDEALKGDSKNIKRVSIMKPGIIPKWSTEKIYIDDAHFTGAMPNGADLRLVTNAYNAFAKIEVVNISAAKKSGNVSIGTVNGVKAEALYKLGLYEGTSKTEYIPALDEGMTREQLIVAMIKAMGIEQEVLTKKLTCPFKDISREGYPYISYAYTQGIVKGDGSGLFHSEQAATKRDLIVYYLRALGYENEGLYEKAMDIATEDGLIKNKDLIFDIDKPLMRDNFVGVAFNALIMDNKKTGRYLISDMLKQGLFTIDQVNKTGSAELVAQTYREPIKLPKRDIIDPLTGRTIHYMNINNSKAIRPYVTQQHWTADGKRFIIGNDKTGAIYEYNTETEELRMLDYASTGGSADAVVTPNDIVFYRNGNNEIWKMDLNTYKKQKVAVKPPYASGLSCIQVTNDGKYLTSYWTEQRNPEDYLNGINRIRIIPRLNCETGEWDSETLHHEFDDDPRYPSVGHPIINPVYENLLFFCHEGTTQDIPDRLWIGDFNTGKTKNLFVQAELPNGMTGETSGHEVWAEDGEDMFFVKYTFNTNIGQSGLVRINKEGTVREYLNGEYKFWHCYPSGDKNWVTGDTQIPGSRSELVLVNTQTYKSYLLTNFWFPNGNHPYQPHPIMTRDGKKVSWQMVDENGMLGCAWMDISDITSQETVGGRTKISPTAEMVSYSGYVSDVSKTTVKGEECFKVNSLKEMSVDLSDEVVSGTDSSAIIRITYLDRGRQPILIHYTSAIKGLGDLANRENAFVKIDRNYTGNWVTTDIPISSANFANAGKHQTDIKINGLYSEVIIKSIEVVKQ